LRITYQWLERLISLTGLKGFILGYSLASISTAFAIYHFPSPLLMLIMLLSLTALAVLSLLLFSNELNTLKDLLTHVGRDAKKSDAILASRGLFSDIKKPLIELVRDAERKKTEFENAMKEIAYSSSELSKNADILFKNTTHQSDSTGSSAAAVTEIGQSIDDVTSRIKAVLHHADQTRNLGDQGSVSIEKAKHAIEQVSGLALQTQGHVKDLAEASKAVSSLSSDLIGIADQTGLLALNAAIEAARAGEYGRGFSVVADEVRALAVRSVKSANDISENIERVNAYMSGVEDSMDQVLNQVETCLSETSTTVTNLNDISRGSESMLDQIRSIAAASEQQSVAAKEISSHIESVAANAQENSYMARQTSEVAGYLVSLAKS